MKSHKTIRDYCQNYGWACGADLKNMYFSVHLAKETQKFFGIRIELFLFQNARDDKIFCYRTRAIISRGLYIF